MILSIAQLIVPFMAFMALDKLLATSGKGDKKDKKVLQAVGAVLIIGVFFLLFKNAFFDFQGNNDGAYGFPDWLVNALQADRKVLYDSSIIRGLIFTVLLGGALWMYFKEILKVQYVLVGIGLLVLVDLWTVDKRYVGEDDFQTQRRMFQQVFQPTKANMQISQDDGYYRVLNLSSSNPFSDGITPYHHYSILGYSAIKMQRYNEVIDQYIRNMTQPVLNMLNTKYYIVKGQNGPSAQRNNGALGNAWLVGEVSMVQGADQEYERLGSIAPAEEAIIDASRFSSYGDQTYSAEGNVELTKFHPEELIYNFQSAEPQFVVFSEIYYAPGWNAYLDGNEVDYARVNYVLRGMEVPAGAHEIVFKYEPFSSTGGKYVVIFSYLLVLGFVGLFFWSEFAKGKA